MAIAALKIVSQVLYDHMNPSACLFPGGVEQEIDFTMTVSSTLMSLQVKRVELVKDRIFVLLAIQSSGPCNCTPSDAHVKKVVYLPLGSSQLETHYYVLNCHWKPIAPGKIFEPIDNEGAYRNAVRDYAVSL